MPGSKTYTSSKRIELLEADIEDHFRQNAHPGFFAQFGNAIIETIKIAASAIVSIYLELVNGEMEPAISTMTINEQLIVLSRKAISFVAVFAVFYILVTFIHATLWFLFDALMNSRMLPSRKRNAKSHFHRVTTNYVMLSMSFENKMREYVRRIETLTNKRHGWTPTNKANADTYIDMVYGYYVETIYYSSLAIEGLKEVLPPVARFGFRQYWNKRFCNYVGLEYIANSIYMLEDTIDRMQITTCNIGATIEKIRLRTEKAERLEKVMAFKWRLDGISVELKKLEKCMSHYENAI